MKITVIGCGRWGSFIAWYLNKIGHDVTIFGRPGSDNFKSLIETRKNKYLTFDETIKMSSNIEEVINFAEIIIISIGAQSLRSFLDGISNYSLKDKTIVLCMKGVEVDTGKRLTEVVVDFVKQDTQVAIWVGPGHVQDFAVGIPNCMVIDSDNVKVKEKLVEEFSSELIRFYFGKDLIGNEIGAASKNVIGIAAGMLDGLGYSSLKGALMSRGTREISRLIKAMGGNELSAYGLCHLGDYEATLFSKYSNNRQFGENLVRKEKYDKLAEGVFTVKALVKLGERYEVDLPICKAIDDVVNFGADPKEKLSGLFVRTIKNEF